MTVLLHRIFLSLITAVGALLIGNSVFHFVIYAIGNQSIFESLRPLHLASLVLGGGLLYFGINKLK